VSDIDGTLTGDAAALDELKLILESHRDRVSFGVASGRSPALVEEAVLEFGLPAPELIIAAAGSEIAEPDWLGAAWTGQMAPGWDRAATERLLAGVDGLVAQDSAGQGAFKVSWLAGVAAAERARLALDGAGVRANLVHSHGRFLDVMPRGVDKGSAVRFAAERLGAGLERTIVAGDSGNDEAMLLCGARPVLVANFDREVAHLAARPDVYTAPRPHAGGVIDGLRYHGAIAG